MRSLLAAARRKRGSGGRTAVAVAVAVVVAERVGWRWRGRGVVMDAGVSISQVIAVLLLSLLLHHSSPSSPAPSSAFLKAAARHHHHPVGIHPAAAGTAHAQVSEAQGASGCTVRIHHGRVSPASTRRRRASSAVVHCAR